MRTYLTVAIALLVAALPAAAQEAPRTLTVNAADDGAFVALGDPAREVEITNAVSSDAWDLSFLGTDVAVNGGDFGPAGVVAYCVCANADASGEAIQQMTPESELEDFLAVTAADVPTDPAEWEPAAFAIDRWYRYNISNDHLIWPLYNVYLVKRGDDVYKVQIIGYYAADGTPRQLTFRYGRV